MRKSIFILILAMLFVFSACHEDKLKVDISGVDAEINVARFDQDLFTSDTTDMWKMTERLSNDYGQFWDLYTQQILNIGGQNDKFFAMHLQEFLADPVIQESYRKALAVFPDNTFLNDELTRSFKHFKYYFPDKNTPVVYAYLGGFNHSVATDEGLLAIGLDKYLGTNCEFYPQLGIPSFARRHLSKENIAGDCMRAWSIMEFPYNDSIDNLLNNMIYNGRLLYFTKAMMPEKHDSTIIRYSKKQYKYCQEFEQEMYAYMVENELLFSTKYKNIMRFTKDGPNTSGFKNSPARVGNYMGWQIVKGFMNNRPQTSLAELMAIEDYQGIFIGSRYNP